MTGSTVTGDPSGSPPLDPIAVAGRGKEITGLDIFQPMLEEISPSRAEELMEEMNADKPSGGKDLEWGDGEAHVLRYWGDKMARPPLILFVHGGSWKIGTYMDSIGSVKVEHLVKKGYAFATVNFTLIPTITVEEQVQEVADALGYLVKNSTKLGFDPDRAVLMGHSSGAHVVTLLGTDPKYLQRANLSIDILKGVIAIDGSNYNAPAEMADSPGPVADNNFSGLGNDLDHLQTMSPTYNAHAPNAGAFLLLHVQRRGGIRQAVELTAALRSAGTNVALHVFEGLFFEGHVRMLLSLGKPDYPATAIMDKWLETHIPVVSAV
jgi:acetyl esterase/lipase